MMTYQVGILKKGAIKKNAFTLIELLVVIAIIGGMMGLAVTLFGGAYAIQGKKEASTLIGSIKFAYNEAATKGYYYRIAFDIDKRSYWLESSATPYLLKTETQQAEEDEQVKKNAEFFEASESPESKPKTGFTFADQSTFKKQVLDKVVKIKDIFVAHQEKPVTEGMAYLYFFPRGLTEPAVITLSDLKEKNFYSIVVEPITGRCRVVNNYVDYTTILQK